jgi:hypothetical protein
MASGTHSADLESGRGRDEDEQRSSVSGGHCDSEFGVRLEFVISLLMGAGIRYHLHQEHFIKRLASQAWLRARLNQKKTLTLENLGKRCLSLRLDWNLSLICDPTPLATVVQQEPEFFFLEGEPT